MKYKNYILSIVLVFTNILVNAQELFAPAGTSVSTSTVVFEYAIGDIIVGSTDNSNFQITQGFSQPRMVIKTYVPDDNFEAYLEANGMGDGIANNDYVTTANISGITSLNVTNQNISDLTGIEDFTSMMQLDCGFNSLISLDLSQNTTITSISCNTNQLTSLDVSGLPITSLNFDNNPLTNLDISNCTGLSGIINVDGNTGQPNSLNLTTLNITGCSNITELTCIGNSLTSLDFTGCNSLQSIHCSNNQITSLDVSGLAVTNFTFDNNPLDFLNISNCTGLSGIINVDGMGGSGPNLSTLNITGCSNITELSCMGNSLTSLDFTGCNSLQSIHCSNNQITSLDVNGLSITNFTFYNNPLNYLDIRNCTGLTGIINVDGGGSGSNLMTLNITGCSNITELSCMGNSLTSLDFTGCNSLQSIHCSNNQITTLDVSGFTNLTNFTFDNNPLTYLNMSNCTGLTGIINIDGMGVSSLNGLYVDGCSGITSLSCMNNHLTSLNLNGCSSLQELYFSNNQISTLDIIGCNQLQQIYAENNQLMSLDVSGLTNLTNFTFGGNSMLNSLNISGCSSLIGNFDVTGGGADRSSGA